MATVNTYNQYYFMAVVGKTIDLPKDITQDAALLEALKARQAFYTSTVGDDEIYTGYRIKPL